MEILILAGLILLNGLFSMAEIALVSARKSRLEAQANKGDKKAEEALKLANKPETFLSTVQMGITVIGGLALSTLLTLIIVPASFSLVLQIEQKIGPILKRHLTTGGKEAPTPVSAPGTAAE